MTAHESLALRGDSNLERLKLAFCVHNHQPADNLPHVFQAAYEKAYRPFLAVVADRPAVKVVLHYSGSLLTWLEENRPELLEEITTLARQGRVELLTGGFYEPILPIIPDRDKLGQIAWLTQYIKDRFGADPKGMWLTERVWHPDLVAPLRSADVRYTIVDDNNFQQVGLSEEDSLGYFTIRGPGGQTLEIFPINARLRRMIPFAPPEEALGHLRRLAGKGNRLVLWADDGEKLGEWPGTHEWVYERRWLERFFDLLADNRDWVELTTLREFLETAPSRGTLDLPPGSYEEMMEWSSGSWHKFLERYPESNLMYRKMLLVSETVNAGPEKQAEQGRRYLYRGQSNDAYWHGVFGGLYLLHLRSGTYRSLLSAENLVSPGTTVRVTRVDFDGDGQQEVLVTSRHLNAYLHSTGGQMFELDHRAIPWNFLATLTRRQEPYHNRLRESDQGRRLLPLHYDWYPRRALIDHFFREDTSLDAFADCQYGEQGDFVDQSYEVETTEHSRWTEAALMRRGGVWVGGDFFPVAVTKRLLFLPEESAVQIRYRIEHHGDTPIDVWFACENNFVLSAGNASARYYRVDDERRRPRLDAKAAFQGVGELTLVDEWLESSLTLRFEEPTDVWAFPVETVSHGLEGPIRSYQASSVSCHWKLSLVPNQPHNISFCLALGRGQ